MDNVTLTAVNPAVIVVPSVVDLALKRNKVKYKDYTNFAKVKEVLSSEDIKHWYSVIEAVTIGGVQVSNKLMGLPINYNNVNNGYSNTDSFRCIHFDPFYWPTEVDINEAKQHLMASNAMTENFYSLYRDECVIFIIVEQGFMQKLEDFQFKLEFLKSYFRKLSEVVSVKDLAKDNLHLQYIAAITSL